MQRLLTLALLALLTIVFASCLEEKCEENRLVLGFEPVVVTSDAWRNSAFICGIPEPVCEAGGFYVYGPYLFMVETNRGLHIYDNSDTRNPRPITFMEAPGGQGIAVRNDILYMNQYTDLVAFDLSNPENPTLVGRTEDVFDPYSIFAQVLGGGEFITDFVETGERRVLTCNSPNWGQNFWREGGVFFAQSRNELAFNFDAGNVTNTAGGTPENVGQGGSLARFTIASSTLYAVDDQNLKAFSLANPIAPVFQGNINLGWGIETIFPYEDKLFIGSQTGMQIFSIANPLVPEHLSTFEHVLACDPVVVANDLAYVTLWGGRDCGSIGDQLEIIDVSNAREPRSLQITPMSSSHGLAVAEGKLFLCSQWEGFRVFDLTDDGLLGEQLDHSTEIFARDVIVLPQNNELIVLGYGQEKGIQQFNYDEAGRLTPTSHISVCD
ncbi:hypothetical protein QWY85_07700 [Neolewinella lacunae]|uniref:LVIVD repeat-containing protein n=1 Tax=Neolewinella lacunae TaxID=1517758 RepID=A0A923T945_9BACT|nr:hypothetical protein [Neolewinella lacunae]MBC6994663.1 hypothetical protein [Neolewinella lacunae]MDN3634535.1 hypothetical protein [Neolewinella lacunae]